MEIIHRHPEDWTEEIRRRNLLRLHETCVRLLRTAGQRDVPPGREPAPAAVRGAEKNRT